MFKGLKKLLKKEEEAKRFQERAQRIRLLEGQRFVFVWNAREFPIQNISETGLGLFLPENFHELPTQMQGEIRLEDMSLPVTVEVKRKTDVILGCQVVGDRSGMRKLIHKHLQTEIGAGKMSEVASENLKKDEGNPRWFFAPGVCELYFLESGGNIFRMQLSFQGTFLEAELGKKARYGRVKEFKDEAGASISQINKSDLVEWFGDFPEDVKKSAARILANIESLKPRDREQLLAMLRA